MGTVPPMTRPLRRYLDRQGKGAIKELAKETKISHTLISRIADGHRGASLDYALRLAKATGLPPKAFLRPEVTTTQSQKTRSRGRN